MVNDIDWNHAFIIIKTTPSAAELVARLVDSVRYNLGIMGVVSGDDTIFITPQTGVNPQQLSEKLNRFFNLNYTQVTLRILSVHFCQHKKVECVGIFHFLSLSLEANE